MARRLHVAVVLVAVAVAGCASPAATTTPSASVDEPSSAPSIAATATAIACPNPYGGDCLGPLAAGSYTTTVFTPALTYTVPAGWANYEDLPGQVLLLPPGATLEGVDPGTSDYVGVYSPVAAPQPTCESRRDTTVAETTGAYVNWLQDNPRFEVSEPMPVTVDSLDGTLITVDLAPNAAGVCSDPEMGLDAFAEVMIGLAPADFSVSATPSLTLHLYLFDVGDRLRAIIVSDVHDEGSDEPDFPAAAQDVIDTFQFAQP